MLKDDTKFKLGDSVRFRSNLAKPRHDWAPEGSHRQVGKIVSFDSDGDCRVRFPGVPTWCCAPGDLEKSMGCDTKMFNSSIS